MDAELSPEAQDAADELLADPAIAAELPTRDPKPAPQKGRRKHRATGKGKGWTPERRKAASERAKREAASRAREPAPVTKSGSVELAGELGGILALPALPAVIVAPSMEQKVFLGEHFMTAGPKTASRLVKASESNAELRAKLESVTRVSVTFTLIYCGLIYLAPAVLALVGQLPAAQAIAAMDNMDQASIEQMMSMIALQDANGASPQTESPAAAETAAGEASPPAPGAVG